MEFDLNLFRQVRETKEVAKMHEGMKTPKQLKKEAYEYFSTKTKISPDADDIMGYIADQIEDQSGADMDDAQYKAMAKTLGLDISESINENSWFAKEKLNRMKARLAKVQKLYKKYPKDSEKYEREGVSLETDIKELEGKIADIKRDIKAVEESKGKKCADCGEAGLTLDNDGLCHRCYQDRIDTTKVVTEVDEATVADPITTPTTKPATKPKTPLAPQPNINPKPKALNADVELFVKARESKVNEAAERFENDRVIVLGPITDAKEVQKYSRGTRWDVDDNSFNTYMEKGYNLYIVIPKNKPESEKVIVSAEPNGKVTHYAANDNVLAPEAFEKLALELGIPKMVVEAKGK